MYFLQPPYQVPPTLLYESPEAVPESHPIARYWVSLLGNAHAHMCEAQNEACYCKDGDDG